MKKLFYIFAFLFLISFTLKAQFSISGYAEAYYAYDTDKDKSIRQFASFAPYRDEFKLDIAQISAGYTSDLVRGLVSIHFGDIPRIGWPANQQYIQQAYIGIQPVKNLWIDAGYFFTHIGAESPLPKDNFFTMFSIGSYFEPFYQSGIRATYSFSEKFSGCLHLINGYNLFDDNNKNKSIGVQLVYSPIEKLTFTYNNLVGNEMAFDPGKTRFTNNFVINYTPSEKIDLIGAFDFITQEGSKIIDPQASANVISGSLSCRYKICPRLNISARVEFYDDPDGVLSGRFINSNNETTGLKTYGFTLGFEYKPLDGAYIRVDSRYLMADSKQKIFYDNSNGRFETILSTGIEFSKIFNANND